MAETGGPRPDMGRVWAHWRRLSRALPTWSLPFTATYSRSAWMLVGNDVIGPFVRSKAIRNAGEIVAPLNDIDLAALRRIAELNVRRGETAFRFNAAAFVTLPTGGLLATAELAPDVFAALDADLGRSILIVLVIWLCFTAFFFAGVWRMRQIAHVVELEAIRRGLGGGEAAPEEGSPATPPDQPNGG